MLPQRYLSAACEEELRVYGDSYRGVGYTKSSDEAEERYAVMLDVIREGDAPVSILDLGCGLGHMLDHIKRTRKSDMLEYTGLDISAEYVEWARRRHPEATFLLLDVLESGAELGAYDYVIMNGLFNFRGDLSQQQMVQYWKQLLKVGYAHARLGLTFNVMSKIVDWERDDLFHVSFDVAARFVSRELSRHFVIRHDYEAFEYTTYVYRAPSRW